MAQKQHNSSEAGKDQENHEMWELSPVMALTEIPERNIFLHGSNNRQKNLCLCFQNLLNDLCSWADKLELLNSVTSFTPAHQRSQWTI